MQLVEVHRAKLGSVVRAKSRICSTIRLRCSIFSPIMRASLARGSPGGNFRSQRMVEHLHHRERIADFVGDLGGEQAEGRELLVLAQLLLDVHHALIEAGLLDGDGGQLGQGGEDAGFPRWRSCRAGRCRRSRCQWPGRRRSGARSAGRPVPRAGPPPRAGSGWRSGHSRSASASCGARRCPARLSSARAGVCCR